ncbi:MAG TPA: hypothetical protein VGG01_26475 [Xanthobacteraceae bacterium]
MTKTKLAAAVAAFAIAASALATTQAQAHHPHFGWSGVGLGFATGAIIGTAIASDGYYYGCHLEPRHDRWGHFVRSVKVCD